MAAPTESSNDVAFSFKIRIPSEDINAKPRYVTNNEGASELANFVLAVDIREGINSSAIYADITIQDSANLIQYLKGSETFEIKFARGRDVAGYALTSYNIDSRSRSGNSEVYIIQCVQTEFLINEVRNVFGSSKVLFKKSSTAKGIIETLMKDYIYGKDKNGNQIKPKNMFIEDSKNTHQFVATNWRVFDTIYWLAKHSVRSGSSDSAAQNGFLFWQSRLGYHFKSVDKMIQEIKEQKYETKTNDQTGKARLYRYTYEPKKSNDETNDRFRIDSIVFPEDKNFLLALRNGSFAGFSVAFDINEFSNSDLSPETFAPVTYTFDKPDGSNKKVINFWNKMEHLESINPIDLFDAGVKAMVNYPKRIRYGMLPNRVFDKNTTKSKDKKQYSELAYLQAYEHIRMTTLKNIQLIVKIPGNLDLYPGYGIEIVIPETKPQGDRIEKDIKYGGRYMIAGVRHLYDNNTLVTELLLYKDSIKKSTAK